MRVSLLRRILPSDAASPLMRQALAWMVAPWLVHVVLRALLLCRPDAFGMPFVGKPDWYLFHAWAFDARWIFLWSLPFALHVGFWERRGFPRWSNMGLLGLKVFHAVLLIATVVDHETQRFMGSHFTPTLFSTYGNGEALRQTMSFLANDKGGQFLPFVSLLGVIPLCVGVAFALRKWNWWNRLPTLRVLGGMTLFVIAGTLFTDVVWTGGNRAHKLRPFTEVLWFSILEKRAADVPQDSFEVFTKASRDRWLREAGADSLWDFPDANLPWWRVPQGGTSIPPADERYNIVLVVMESHRALHCGFMKPFGSTLNATPFLDSIAPKAEIWTNYHTASLPTIRALTSMHLGILNHPNRNIVTDYLQLRNQSFSALLGKHGWTTRFFSSADPSWDNQTPWLRQWYQSFDYHRTRERDADMFVHAAQWMRQKLSTQKPFLVTLMTKTNHYPFNREPGVEAADSDMPSRMKATMRYTERSLAAFVDSLRKEPWFSKTIFVFTGDHGFPLNEHGYTGIGGGLYMESTWLPLVIWGKHPMLERGRVHHNVATQVDIGPTILALAGLRTANHFTGHNLLATRDSNALRIAVHSDELLALQGRWAAHGAVAKAPRERGVQLFDRRLDPREEHDVAGQLDRYRDSLLTVARQEAKLLGAVLTRNALAPESR